MNPAQKERLSASTKTTHFRKTWSKVLLSTFPLLLLIFSQANGQAQTTGTDTTYYDRVPDSVEYTVLSELYTVTKGKKWKVNTNWLNGATSTDFARWYGVTVANGDVISINLDNNNLNGVLPKSLSRLSCLQMISVEGNSLSEARNRQSGSSQVISLSQGSMATMSATMSSGGLNLPVWGLAVQGPSAQQVDWRNTPPVVENITNSGTSAIAPTGIAIDHCGRIAFYLLHSGVNSANQLHIYSEDGTLLTDNAGLNGLSTPNEVQVVKVPGFSNEWYAIYSLHQSPCLGSPGYCPAIVAYSRIRYTIATQELVILERDVVISSSTFIQGKAVSKATGSPLHHYLYLAQRSVNYHKTRIHRFIIDATNIRADGTSAEINAGYWNLTIPGSSVELSPDGTVLCITNRNELATIHEDVILFNLNEFDSPTPNPVLINARNLIVQPDNINLFEPRSVFELYTLSQYQNKFRCLAYFKNKLSAAEFSPSGRYLYLTGGGYPVGTGYGRTYNTYLVQIDLQSGTGNGDYNTRIQIQEGVNVNSNCVGDYISQTGNNWHQMFSMQSAFDGRIYFTKSKESNLFVIPHPDEPMPQRLTPGQVDLSAPGIPNIPMRDNAFVAILPENIDGLNYLEGSDLPSSAFDLDNSEINNGESVTVAIPGFSTANSYTVQWGDGSAVEAIPSGTVTHLFPVAGTYTIRVTAISPTSCETFTEKILNVNNTCYVISDLNIAYEKFICAFAFTPLWTQTQGCTVTSYSWDFGDGTISSEKLPTHGYSTPGTYTVSLSINYQCGACTPSTATKQRPVTFIANEPEIFKDTIIHVVTDVKQQVLSNTAVTFSDAWPLLDSDLLPGINNSFLNGTQGVWRNESSFIYNVLRDTSSVIDISKDGTYTLEQFSWERSDLEAIPNWIKASTVTQYSPFSYELENRDVLGIHSAALYDYGGHLPSANGVNMRHSEMAFTGFEYLEGKSSGNWMFGTDTVNTHRLYRIRTARKNIALVEASIDKLEDVGMAHVLGRMFLQPSFKYIFNNEILCREVYSGYEGWTVIVFRKPLFTQLWHGELRVNKKLKKVPNTQIDNTFAHTGRSSLKITNDQTFEQLLLKLDSGKSYLLCAWVSVNNVHVTTPKLADNLGIDVIFTDKDGSVLSTTTFEPSGQVIEGWQQVRGTVTCPDEEAVLKIRFRRGSTGTAWYDDLRWHPEQGNMKAYVYNLNDYRLQAVLDEENFASLYYYDHEGNLHLVEKETQDGIKTLSENISYQVEN